MPARTARKFSADGGPNQASLIAWSALLAMFPIVLTIATVLGLALRYLGITSGKILADLLAILPSDAHVDAGLIDLQQNAGILGLVALLGLVWSGTALFGTMEQAFAVIYHVPPRPFLRQRLMSVGMIFVFTVLGGLAVLTSTLLPVVERFQYFPPLLKQGTPALALQVAIGAASGFLLFLAIYYVVPNRRQRFGQVWPGAALAGALFEAMSLLFPLYIRYNHGFNRYGAGFALLFLMMSFFYFLGLVTMLGVELNSVLYPIEIKQSTAGLAEVATLTARREEEPGRTPRGRSVRSAG